MARRAKAARQGALVRGVRRQRLGDLFIWGLFYQKIVHPLVWGEPGDQERIAKSIDEEIPAALDYLEPQLPAEGFLSEGSESRTSRSPAFSATALMRDLKQTRSGGRARPRSSSERSHTPASRIC